MCSVSRSKMFALRVFRKAKLFPWDCVLLFILELALRMGKAAHGVAVEVAMKNYGNLVYF